MFFCFGLFFVAEGGILVDGVLYLWFLFVARLQRTNKEGTSSRERTAAFGLIMPGGPPPAFPADHSVFLPSIASQTSACKDFFSPISADLEIS